MKKYLIILFITIFQNISFAQTQLEMNEDAYNNYLKTDKELNITYQKIIKQYKDDKEFTKNLKISQKIWIQFRHAEMKMKFPDREDGFYGSIHPMCWSNYLEKLTTIRIKQLKIWLTGIEEGDACSGSVKIKE